jgi:membrane-bound ClpP family serine protease
LWGLYELLLPEIPIGGEIESMVLTGLTIGIIGGFIALILLFRLMTKTKFWTKLTAPGIESQEAGFSTSIGLEDQVGKTGTAATDLRPAGWITVDDKRIFVVTEGDYISQNNAVTILSVDGNRVVVRKLKTEFQEDKK